MITTVYPSSVAGKLLIQLLIWLLGIGVAGILVIAIISVTFMDNTVIQDAHWEPDKGFLCFTVLNNYSAFNKVPRAFSGNECAPPPTAATPVPSANPAPPPIAQHLFGIIQSVSLHLLASFKELWLNATDKQCRPFLYLRDNGNNCVSKICNSVEVKNFDIHGEPQQDRPFSFLTTAKSQLIAHCSLDSSEQLPPGALMIFYGFSCESHSEQQNCERQSLVHTDHRVNYIVP